MILVIHVLNLHILLFIFPLHADLLKKSLKKQIKYHLDQKD